MDTHEELRKLVIQARTPPIFDVPAEALDTLIELCKSSLKDCPQSSGLATFCKKHSLCDLVKELENFKNRK